MARTFASVLGLVVAGCAGPKAGPADSAAPAADASFAAIRAEILLPSCGFSTCHGSGTGGLRLDEAGAYDALVDAPATGAPGEIRVVPGDPDGSYLVKKLEGAPDIVGTPMPPPSGGAPAADIGRIRTWIADGAAP